MRYALDTQGGLPERLGTLTTTGSTTASTWYVRGFGEGLARETATGTAWYLGDRQGSVRATYGATATSLGVRTDYDPFGTPLAGPGLVAPTDYGYAGEPQDAATGLVQLRARWYSPALGQFTARDPFGGDTGTPRGYNPYGYAYADPVNNTDPTGLTPGIDPGAGGGDTAFSTEAIDRFLKQVSGPGGVACGLGPSLAGTLLLQVPVEEIEQAIEVTIHYVQTQAPNVVAQAPRVVAAGGAVAIGADAAGICTVICPVILIVGGAALVIYFVATSGGPQQYPDRTTLPQRSIPDPKGGAPAVPLPEPYQKPPVQGERDNSANQMRVQLQDDTKRPDHTYGLPIIADSDLGVSVRQVRDALQVLYNTISAQASWFPSSLKEDWLRSAIIRQSIKIGQYPPSGTTRGGNIEREKTVYRGVEYRLDIENLRGYNLRR